MSMGTLRVSKRSSFLFFLPDVIITRERENDIHNLRAMAKCVYVRRFFFFFFWSENRCAHWRTSESQKKRGTESEDSR